MSPKWHSVQKGVSHARIDGIDFTVRKLRPHKWRLTSPRWPGEEWTFRTRRAARQSAADRAAVAKANS